jgi:acetyltransferase-like isoleucine patch superfamily enzyme
MLNFLKQILEKIELRRYNEFTIENYFRKKGYSVGKNNRIFLRNLGSEPYLVKIGNYCLVSSTVKFITHDGVSALFRDEIPSIHVFGKIEIKDKCFLGAGAIILPNVTIGPNSVVGAGAVVTKDVPAGVVVAGVPAKVICSIEEYREKCVKKWNELNLRGPRETWEKQLKDYFWHNDK